MTTESPNILWLKQHGFLCLLCSTVALMLGQQFSDSGVGTGVLLHALFNLTLFASLFAVRRSKRWLIVAAALAVPSFISHWARIAFPVSTAFSSVSFEVFGHYANAAFLFIVVTFLITDLFKARRVTADRLCGGLAAYLLLGIVWGSLYVALETGNPGAFALPDSEPSGDSQPIPNLFYYSFVTLTTLGFGDAVPVSQAAKSLTIWEAIIGQAYLVVLVARLVALHTSHTASPNDAPAGS